MTTQEVANRLVSLCREGKNVDAINELYAENIVSIEPDGAPHKEVAGKQNVLGKTLGFFDMVEEVHGAHTSDPVIADNFFSCSMSSDVTFKGGPRTKIEEVAVYQVENGKIVKEQFFFTPQPAATEA